MQSVWRLIIYHQSKSKILFLFLFSVLLISSSDFSFYGNKKNHKINNQKALLNARSSVWVTLKIFLKENKPTNEHIMLVYWSGRLRFFVTKYWNRAAYTTLQYKSCFSFSMLLLLLLNEHQTFIISSLFHVSLTLITKNYGKNSKSKHKTKNWTYFALHKFVL